jgi:23S rRNA pseudouridine1911/1915/1917 synthase
VHPDTGKEMFFEAPIPDDMERLLDKWRNRQPAGKEV